MKKRKRPTREKIVSYHKKPEDMSIVDWQRQLRVQFARNNDFDIENIGDQPFFSEFNVSNPKHDTNYKVAFRDDSDSHSFCSCADFKINQLGTCKHIEAVRARLERKRGYKTAMKRGFHPEYSSIYLHYLHGLKVKLRCADNCPKSIIHAARRCFSEEGELMDEAYDRVNTFISSCSEADHELRVYPDAMDYIIRKRANNKRNKLIDRLIPDVESTTIFDKLIKANLYPYQRKGVLFAIRSGRGVIADDMGLGKTIQAICASEFYFTYLHIQKVLIICPTSLKLQWKNEIEKFTDSSVHVVEGPVHKRSPQYDLENQYFIISHGVARNDVELINDAGFDIIILDEAQRIKNWDTKTSRAFKQLESPYAWALSGTPVENKLQELYSVMQFVDIFKLGPLHHFLARHCVRDENGQVTGYTKLDKIGTIIADRLIRRKKEAVLDELPERIDMNRYVEMTNKQWGFYDAYKAAVAGLVRLWRKKGFLTEKERQKLLINLSCMRMVCNSTYIVDQTTRADTKIDELSDILAEILSASDDKVVIFSEWKRMHTLILKMLEASQLDYRYLHGSLKSDERGRIIDEFHQDPGIRIFLSTDAGGQGLNLQVASVVVNMDLPWNPAVLEQRVGRIHRIGQRKTIRVINLISKETIEFFMLERLQFKSGMAAGILDGGDADVFMPESKFKEVMKDLSGVLENEDRTLPRESTRTGDEEVVSPERMEGVRKTDVEEISINDESSGKEEPHIAGDRTSERVLEQSKKMEEVMNSGLQFLSGMMEMMTGGKASFKDQKIEMDPETGEVVLRFKIDS